MYVCIKQRNIYMYIYICIYIHTERKRERERDEYDQGGFQDQGGCTYQGQGLRYCIVEALPNQPHMTQNSICMYAYMHLLPT